MHSNRHGRRSDQCPSKFPDATSEHDLTAAFTAWRAAKARQTLIDGRNAALTPSQIDRLARMPSHWPAERPEAPTEAPDATPPRRSEPPLHEVLARLAPSVTHATQRRRAQQAAR